MHSKSRLFSIIYAVSGYFVFGFTSLLTSSLLPQIEQTFGINHTQVGLFLFMNYFFFISGSIFGGILFDKVNPTYISSMGQVMIAIASIIMFKASNFIHLLVANSLIGFGSATIEVGIPIMISSSGRKKVSGILNKVQAFYSIGAITGPILVSIILSRALNWRFLFLLPMFICLSLSIIVLFLNDRFKHVEVTSTKKSLSFLKSYMAIMLLICISIYTSYETGFSSWLSTFLFDFRKFPMSISALLPSILWAGLFSGRTLLGGLTEKLGYRKWLILSSSLAAASTIATALLSFNLIITYITVFMVGLSFSTIYPTTLAWLLESFQKSKGVLMGIVGASSSLFAAITNYAIGFVGDRAGIFTGFAIVCGLTCAEIVFTFKLKKE
jgi:FHS family glucose/mannose:H+ symporter-like MFS transporter